MQEESKVPETVIIDIMPAIRRMATLNQMSLVQITELYGDFCNIEHVKDFFHDLAEEEFRQYNRVDNDEQDIMGQ